MNLNHITSVIEANEALKKYVGGWLSLNGLTRAEGLELPNTIGGWLSLNSLTRADRNQIRKEYPNIRVV